MRREKKFKPIQIDRETYKIMYDIWGPNIPYNPTIKKEGGDKQDVDLE